MLAVESFEFSLALLNKRPLNKASVQATDCNIRQTDELQSLGTSVAVDIVDKCACTARRRLGGRPAFNREVTGTSCWGIDKGSLLSDTRVVRELKKHVGRWKRRPISPRDRADRWKRRSTSASHKRKGSSRAVRRLTLSISATAPHTATSTCKLRRPVPSQHDWMHSNRTVHSLKECPELKDN